MAPFIFFFKRCHYIMVTIICFETFDVDAAEKSNQNDKSDWFVQSSSCRIINSFQLVHVNVYSAALMLLVYFFVRTFFWRLFNVVFFPLLFLFIIVIISFFLWSFRKLWDGISAVVNAMNDNHIFLYVFCQLCGSQDPKSHCPTPSLHAEWILPGDGLEWLTRHELLYEEKMSTYSIYYTRLCVIDEELQPIQSGVNQQEGGRHQLVYRIVQITAFQTDFIFYVIAFLL